jgi:isopenicillin N synthase-like dioxygenase
MLDHYRRLPEHAASRPPQLSGRDRLSFPLFFDPDFDARIAPIRCAATDDRATRWDGVSVHDFEGSYGDYVLGKVGKVFPDLRRALQLGAAVGGRAASTIDPSS